jgi:hypothetical protein
MRSVYDSRFVQELNCLYLMYCTTCFTLRTLSLERNYLDLFDLNRLVVTQWDHDTIWDKIFTSCRKDKIESKQVRLWLKITDNTAWMQLLKVACIYISYQD